MRERDAAQERREFEPEPYQPTALMRAPMYERLGFESAEQASSLLWAALHPYVEG